VLPQAHLALWLSSSDDGKIVLYAAAGFVIGILLFVRGFRMLQRKRLILDTPASHIRSAAIGLVELNGLAVGPNTITSPITMRPSLYYRTALWREVGSGKNRHWELAVDERFHVPFFLKDQTGMVLVNPHGAEMDIHCDFTGSYSTSMFSGANVPPRVVEFAAANGISVSSPLKVEEYCLKPRNALYILGTLATNPGLTCGPTPVPTLPPSTDVSKFDLAGGSTGLASSLVGLANLKINVSVTKPVPTFAPSGPVKLTDIDRKLAEHRAGQHPPETVEKLTDIDRRIAAFHAAEPSSAAVKPHIDPADPRARSAAVVAAAALNPAAAAAIATVGGTSLPQAIAQTTGAAAAQPAKETPRPASGPDGFAVDAREELYPDKSPTVICKGEHNPAFYISWRSQKEVVSELSTRSTLFIFGGPALSALCLWYLLWYLRAL
jgi:hypothetical protein